MKKPIRSKHLQKRDVVAEAFNEPKCFVCGLGIPRTVFKSGVIQARTVWLKRKVCSNKKEPRKPSSCGIEYHRLVSQFQPQPETHKYCKICEKRLAYRSINTPYKVTGYCYKCFVVNGGLKKPRIRRKK